MVCGTRAHLDIIEVPLLQQHAGNWVNLKLLDPILLLILILHGTSFPRKISRTAWLGKFLQES